MRVVGLYQLSPAGDTASVVWYHDAVATPDTHEKENVVRKFRRPTSWDFQSSRVSRGRASTPPARHVNDGRKFGNTDGF